MNSVNFLNVEYIFEWIYNSAKSFNPAAVINWLVQYIITPILPVAFVFSLLLIILIIYCIVKLMEVAKIEKEQFGVPKEDVPVLEQHNELNQKWIEVQSHLNSTNPSDWRLAIIEADIMLGDVLDAMGYHGDSIGDQLKSVIRRICSLFKRVESSHSPKQYRSRRYEFSTKRSRGQSHGQSLQESFRRIFLYLIRFKAAHAKRAPPFLFQIF